MPSNWTNNNAGTKKNWTNNLTKAAEHWLNMISLSFDRCRSRLVYFIEALVRSESLAGGTTTFEPWLGISLKYNQLMAWNNPGRCCLTCACLFQSFALSLRLSIDALATNIIFYSSANVPTQSLISCSPMVTWLRSKRNLIGYWTSSVEY